MGLPNSNMTRYFDYRGDVVDVVDDQLRHLPNDWPWTMTIIRERSGGYSVRTVIDTSSDDTDYQTAQFFSATQVNT